MSKFLIDFKTSSQSATPTSSSSCRLASASVQLRQEVEAMNAQATDEQRQVLDEVYASVRDSAPRIFFLGAPGGTGKTFVENLLLDRVRVDVSLSLCFHAVRS
jgi:superfamily II DNA or RNA helicase